MTDAPLSTPQDDDMQAAEYALGLAEGEALTAARARLGHDAAFAARVANWQERLVTLTDDIAPVTPDRRARRELLARLFSQARVPLMQRLWLWQGISFAALAMVAYLAMPLLRPPAPEVPAKVYATQMSAENSGLQVLAVLDTARGDIALRRLAGQAPAGRVLELWAILPDTAPVSLGVLPGTETVRVALPAGLLAQAAQITLAISDEPTGGSPTGAPTGSVLAAGAVSAL